MNFVGFERKIGWVDALCVVIVRVWVNFVVRVFLNSVELCLLSWEICSQILGDILSQDSGNTLLSLLNYFLFW